MAAVIELWNRANSSKVANISTSTDNTVRLTASDELNDQGACEFTIQADHAAAGDIAGGLCVRVYNGTDLVNTYTIREVEEIVVADEDEKVIRVRCVGMLARFEEGLVQPWIDGRPISRDRVFNWTNPDLDLSGWSSTTYNQTWANSQWPRLPEGWPKDSTTDTHWIWTQADADVQPVGWCLFRRSFTLADPATIAFYVAANSTFEFWVDSVLLDREPNKQPDRTGYEATRRYVVSLSAGTHHIAAAVENWGGSISDNPAGLACSAWTVESDTLQTLLFTTRAADTSWKCLDYPSTYPSRSFPEIVDKLLDEMQAVDELLGWTIDDHSETFDEVEEFVCRVGDTLWQVLEQGAATYCDIWADPEGLVLHIVPKDVGRGSASGVTIASGTNLVELTTSVSNQIVNAVTGIWAEGVRTRTDSTSITANGRRPKSFDVGGVSNRRALDAILDEYLAAYKDPLTSLVADVVSTTGDVAGVDFLVGDSVTLEGDTARCVGIAWQVGTGQGEGELIGTPEFDTLLAVQQKERRRAIERQVAAFEQPASASILDKGTLIPFGTIGTTSKTYSWSGDIEETLDVDDPDNPWQISRVDKTQRFYLLRAEIPSEYLADAFDDTVIKLVRNGTDLYTVTLTTSDELVELDIPPTVIVYPKDKITVRCTAAGGHVDGAVDILMADPV